MKIIPLLILLFSAAACSETMQQTEEISVQNPRTSAPSASLSIYEVGNRPRAVAVEDLNGDGNLDIVVANSGDDTVTFLLGQADGQISSSNSPFPAGQEPSDVDAVDLDQDGDIDLVVANHGTSVITVLVNDGSGRFTQSPTSSIDTGARPHLHGLASGDFDGDGWTDVAVDGSDTRELKLIRGSILDEAVVASIPLSTMPYYRLGTADVTGDGILDILVPGHSDNTIRVIHYADDSFSLARTINLSGQPWMVVADDVNGDLRNDVIVVETDSLSVWLETSAGFTPALGSPFRIVGATDVATGDLNGDGIGDIVVGPWDGDHLTVLLGGDLTMHEVLACERPIGLAIADLEQDGYGEVIAACAVDNSLAIISMFDGN